MSLYYNDMGFLFLPKKSFWFFGNSVNGQYDFVSDQKPENFEGTPNR